jgi:hypothetical protein
MSGRNGIAVPISDEKQICGPRLGRVACLIGHDLHAVGCTVLSFERRWTRMHCRVATYRVGVSLGVIGGKKLAHR